MSIFNSSTHGPIEITEGARQMLRALRLALSDSMRQGAYHSSMSLAQGELAKYIAKLESSTRADAQPVKECADARPTGKMPELAFGFAPKSFSPYPYQAAMMEQLRRRPYKPLVSYFGDSPGFIYGGSRTGRITGNRIDSIILDELTHKQEKIDMSKKAVAARKRVAKVVASLQTVGVRFLHSHSLEKIYTYKAKKSAKLFLGQEIVVSSEQYGRSVGVVVALGGDAPMGWSMDTLKEISSKVAAV